MSDDGRYSLALTEARRSLDHQAVDVARIRERVTSLVTVGGLAAAFIGGLALREDAPQTAWTIVGALAFAGLLGTAVFALWPRRVRLTQKADVLIDWVDVHGADRPQMERELARYLTEQYDSNARKLDVLTNTYVVGLGLLLVEIVALLVDLRGR